MGKGINWGNGDENLHFSMDGVRLLKLHFSLLVVIGANPRRASWSKAVGGGGGGGGWGLNVQQYYQVRWQGRQSC